MLPPGTLERVGRARRRSPRRSVRSPNVPATRSKSRRMGTDRRACGPKRCETLPVISGGGDRSSKVVTAHAMVRPAWCWRSQQCLGVVEHSNVHTADATALIALRPLQGLITYHPVANNHVVICVVVIAAPRQCWKHQHCANISGAYVSAGL